MGELVATLALAQDNAFAQPLESQLRSCLLAQWLSDEADLDSRAHETVYWVSLLRYIGCTGHAHEVASVFGDEMGIRAQSLVHDASNPAEVIQDVLAFATANHPPEERDQVTEAILAGAHDWAVHNFASGCEVGDMLVSRLGFEADVRDALRCTFERWNGNGFPAGVKGEQIPLAMRFVHVTHDMEAIARRFSPERALEALVERSDRAYDPALVELFAANGVAWFERLDKVDPWDAVLGLEPTPPRTLTGPDLDEALLVVADFVDLKSPFMSGHSRRCAGLAADAARVLGLDQHASVTLRRAALVHELGTTGLSNAILDKPSSLTRAERDRVEIHPLLTEQMLRRSPALAMLNPVACCHHEKSDGSGYPKGVRIDAHDSGVCVLEAVDIYVGMTTDRADRPAVSGAQAAVELRVLASSGVLNPQAVEAVLSAAGHPTRANAVNRKAERPGGLTGREVDVLRLAARGLTTQQIADELVISPKTADHHIQHIYAKISVSTRAAAALWAMQNSVFPDPRT
jgi:HD-GYP domain-containing protein (c-di-GMP phosphodiesterase class II)